MKTFVKRKCPKELKPTLKKMNIPYWSFLSADENNVYTSQGTIEDAFSEHPHKAQIDCRSVYIPGVEGTSLQYDDVFNNENNLPK